MVVSRVLLYLATATTCFWIIHLAIDLPTPPFHYRGRPPSPRVSPATIAAAQKDTGKEFSDDDAAATTNTGAKINSAGNDRVDDARGDNSHRRLNAVDSPGFLPPSKPPPGWTSDVHSLLTSAQRRPEEEEIEQRPFRVLYVVTSLTEYDKGTRGTAQGYDRLRNVMLPALVDSVSSMTDKGWHVDVFLVLGYERLKEERREEIVRALPDGVGLEVWEDAIPLHYDKTHNRGPHPGQSLTPGMHALSRQHRFVVRDKLHYYDFFICFEDDMKVTADHVLNFLDISADIESLAQRAESSADGTVHAEDESPLVRAPNSRRHAPNDGASVGNDVVDDPISADRVRRLFPGLLRVEVLDRNPGHPLRGADGKATGGTLDRHRFVGQVPPERTSPLMDPDVCCREDSEPGRGRMTPHPHIDEVVMWETNIQASGVRRFPSPLGWVGVMPVETRADVGSYWSGFEGVFGASEKKRPRRIDATIGNQAGFMATRKQIEYFHAAACPGGFLPPYNDAHWRGDSLQKHSVEFWSGGFQLFGQCFFNRVLSLDPVKFERQIVNHVASNKQRTVPAKKFVRIGDFFGQLHTVRRRAEEYAKDPVHVGA